MTYMNYGINPNIMPNLSTTLQLPITNVPKTSKIGEAFKPKKAGNNGSHVVLVVDESGSMQHLRDSTIASVNEFIEAQRVDSIEKNIPTVVSIYTFDGVNVKAIVNKVDVKANPTINRDNYNPVGGTNLNDAFGSVIATINEDFSKLKKKDRSSVIISVMTDGMENTSRTFTKEDVNQMVVKCQDSKWAFVFMGANIDAFAAGSAYGFNQNNTLQYGASGAGLSGSMASATRMVSSMKSAFDAGHNDVASVYAATAFTDEERTKSMGEKNE